MASVEDTANGYMEPTSKCPDQVIIKGSDQNVHTDRRYIEFLGRNGIVINAVTASSLRLSDLIGTRQIGIVIISVLGGSAMLGGALGCNDMFSVGCQAQVFRETKTTLSDEASLKRSWPDPKAFNANHMLPSDFSDLQRTAKTTLTQPGPVSSTINLGGSETSLVDRQQTKGAPFNLPVFQASIIVWAFILAFSRWMIENRQSSMSELFERKKEVNLLLLKDEKGVFQPLISEALRAAPTPVVSERIVLDANECQALLRRSMTSPLASNPEPGSLPDNAEFLRQMFVYIELDNFELALNRYVTGLLDPEQMYRAWEIMQSRCLSRTFRYMAAVQGLKYYTQEFHGALAHVLIRTTYFDRELDRL